MISYALNMNRENGIGKTIFPALTDNVESSFNICIAAKL